MTAAYRGRPLPRRPPFAAASARCGNPSPYNPFPDPAACPLPDVGRPTRYPHGWATGNRARRSNNPAESPPSDGVIQKEGYS